MNPIELLPNPETTFQAIGQIFQHVEPPKVKEQRISVRQQVFQPIDVQGLDESFRPKGDVIQALSRDVSVAGCAFFLNQPVTCEWLRLSFTECEHTNLIVEVMHQRQLGPFWVVGCKFLVNWDTTDWNADSDDEFGSFLPA